MKTIRAALVAVRDAICAALLYLAALAMGDL